MAVQRGGRGLAVVVASVTNDLPLTVTVKYDSLTRRG